jgi:predicted peptidase
MPQTAHRFEIEFTRSAHLDYLLSLPPEYEQESSRRFPLLFFLHGAGERSGSGIVLEHIKVNGPPKRVEKKHTLPFIILSPQCPMDTWWSSHIDTLMALLDHISTTYRVDAQRIYLTGLSMGGFGTWHLGALYPERFAAIAPICGGMPWFVGLESAAQRMKNLPVWAFHGAKDTVVELEESERVVQCLKAAGNKVKFTVYREADHDSWTKTYANPKLYEWFLQHKR